MKNLKRVVAAILLTLIFGLSAFAGEVNTPPCANPGEMNAPPCSASQFTSDDPAALGETGTPPSSMLADASALAISAFEGLSY
jgi:hypothetical protein